MPILLERIQLIKLNPYMDYRANEKIQISIFKYAYLDFLI